MSGIQLDYLGEDDGGYRFRVNGMDTVIPSNFASTPKEAASVARRAYRLNVQKDQYSHTGSFVRGMIEGSTSSFDDEAMGLVGQREATKDDKVAAQGAHPIAYGNGVIAGSMVPAGLITKGPAAFLSGGATASRNAGWGAKAGTAMGAGAGSGALFGIGEGEEAGDRAWRGTIGGIGGGLVGGSLGLLGSGIARKGGDKIGDALTRRAGISQGTAVPMSGPERRGIRDAYQQALDVGLDPKRVEPGRPLAAQSKGLAEEVGGYARKSAQATDFAEQRVDDVYAAMRDRMRAGMQRASKGPESAAIYADDLVAARRAEADKLYGAAEAATKDLRPDPLAVATAEDIIRRYPGVIPHAKKKFGLARIPGGVRQDGQFRFYDTPSYRELERIASAAKDLGYRGAGDVNLQALGGGLSDTIDEFTGAFKPGREAFSAARKLEDAFEYGQNVFSKTGEPSVDAAMFIRQFDNMDKARQDMITKGIYGKVAQRLDSRPSTADPIMRNMFRSEGGRQILSHIFGEDIYNSLARQGDMLEDATRLAREGRNVGSQTGSRRAVDNRQAGRGEIFDAVTGGGEGMYQFAMSKLRGAFSGGNVPEEELQGAIRLLTEQNPKEMDILIRSAAAGDEIALRGLTNRVAGALMGGGGGVNRAIFQNDPG